MLSLDSSEKTFCLAFQKQRWLLNLSTGRCSLRDLLMPLKSKYNWPAESDTLSSARLLLHLSLSEPLCSPLLPLEILAEPFSLPGHCPIPGSYLLGDLLHLSLHWTLPTDFSHFGGYHIIIKTTFYTVNSITGPHLIHSGFKFLTLITEPLLNLCSIFSSTASAPSATFLVFWICSSVGDLSCTDLPGLGPLRKSSFESQTHLSTPQSTWSLCTVTFISLRALGLFKNCLYFTKCHSLLWFACPLQHSGWNLITIVGSVLRGGTFKKWLDPEEAALMNGLGHYHWSGFIITASGLLIQGWVWPDFSRLSLTCSLALIHVMRRTKGPPQMWPLNCGLPRLQNYKPSMLLRMEQKKMN